MEANIPYKNTFSGEVQINTQNNKPFTVYNPYLTLYPNRKARRFNSQNSSSTLRMDKFHVQVEHTKSGKQKFIYHLIKKTEK